MSSHYDALKCLHPEIFWDKPLTSFVDQNTYVVKLDNKHEKINYLIKFLRNYYQEVFPYCAKKTDNGFNFFSYFFESLIKKNQYLELNDFFDPNKIKDDSVLVLRQNVFNTDKIDQLVMNLFKDVTLDETYDIVFNPTKVYFIKNNELSESLKSNNIETIITINSIDELLFNSKEYFNYLISYPGIKSYVKVYKHNGLRSKSLELYIAVEELRKACPNIKNKDLDHENQDVFILEIANFGESFTYSESNEYFLKEGKTYLTLDEFKESLKIWDKANIK